MRLQGKKAHVYDCVHNVCQPTTASGLFSDQRTSLFGQLKHCHFAVDGRYGKQPDASSSAGDSANGAAQNGAAPFLGNIQKPDGKEALAFIRAHSPDGDEDLLPGLCEFAERWLVQVWHPTVHDSTLLLFRAGTPILCNVWPG